jgi:hypothetical protein
MSALMEHAKSELAILRGPDAEPDEMQDDIEKNVLDIVQIFADAGHSGSSGAYTLGILKRVLDFQPITPLTGDDSEWLEVGTGVFQNKRCGRVFRGKDGKAYDIEGKVFRNADGSCFTSRDSRVYITFPYRPTTEFVDVK